MIRRSHRYGLFLTALLACFLFGCSGQAGSRGTPVPVITAFSTGAAAVDPGNPVDLAWTVSGASSLSLDNGIGTVTGRTSLTVSPSRTTTYTLTAANAGGSVTARTTVAVNIKVSLDPPALVVTPGAVQPFTATVQGCSDPGVAWSIAESDGGWITSDGIYIAPAAAGVYHIQATSREDASVRAQAAVTVDVIGVSVLPATSSLATRGSLALTGTVSGASVSSGLTWSLLEPAGGTLVDHGDNTALYTAPDAPGTYHVRAASIQDPERTAIVSFTVRQVTVAVSPVAPTVLTSASQAFTATVSGSSNTGVTWALVEEGGGSITESGVYTAPDVAGTYHLRATSVADPSVSDTVPVTVQRVGVGISPALATLAPGARQQFAASVAGTEDTRVTWQVQEDGGGQIDASGAYTAPASTGTYHVTAYSVADPTRSATATVAVPSRTLTVTLGAGVTGTPSTTGTAVHGQVIAYRYAAQSGYTNLKVRVDGVEVPASGAIIMDGDHTLLVSADVAIVVNAYCTLQTTVTGAVGGPAAGSVVHPQGTLVAYGYALAPGYRNLVVLLDGSPVPASGTITADRDHTLIVSAEQIIQVTLLTKTLTVSLGPGLFGMPSLTYVYEQGTVITFAYGLLPTNHSEGTTLVVSIDGEQLQTGYTLDNGFCTGTLVMDRDHQISVVSYTVSIHI